MPINSTSRLKRLRQALDRAGAGTLLETHLPNIYYICGFSGDSGALLVDPASATLFTDGRFTIQAKEETRGIRVHIHKGPLLEAVGTHLRGRKRLRVAVSPSRLTLGGWKTLRKAAGGNLKWVAVDCRGNWLPDAAEGRFR
jgi:Xaa-Pro aminopeptidase